MVIKRALISVSDKTGVVEFAHELAAMAVEIISTGGTAAVLKKAGIPVTDISDYTGFPEMMDGRLKTLHPKIHGGILGIRDNKIHVTEMKKNGIEPIDMVIVNLYPFEQTIAKKDCTFEEAIENIDIGGPTMIRAAAKNHRDVTVVCDPTDYVPIIKEIKKNNGALSDEMKFRLAKKVFAHTARYDAAIITYLSKYDDIKNKLDSPFVTGFIFEKVQDLRYGENPHQKAAFYHDSHKVNEPSVTNATQLHGKELSYNNIMDADAAIEIAAEFYDTKFAAVIVKHANPCGAAVCEESLSSAFAKALACDPISAFGGIIAVNRTMDEATAKQISQTFFEVIIAPDFEKCAEEILKKKKNLRLLKVAGLGKPFTASGTTLRKVVGGVLIQDRDTNREDIRKSKVVTKRAPTNDEWKALEFGWRICKYVKSNAIVYSTIDRTLGIGAGQMSRVDSSHLAVMKAKSSLKGSIVASDAFFPFRDGIDEAAKAGATAIIQPGGSIKDNEVIAAADEHGLAMVFTGVRHFRH